MVAPTRQNLAPLSVMFGALGESLDCTEKTLYVNEKCLNGEKKNHDKIEQFGDQKIIRKFEEGSIPVRKCVTNSPDHVCKTSLADCLPSPVGSPEEFEPLVNYCFLEHYFGILSSKKVKYTLLIAFRI